MPDASLRDHTQRLERDPLPEDNLLVHQVRLELLLGSDVEYLELSTGCSKSRRRKVGSASKLSPSSRLLHGPFTSRQGKGARERVRKDRRRTLESEDLLLRMHHRRISRDRPSNDVVGIVQVDNDDIVLVSNADERVGLESEGLEGDGSGLDAERCELFSQRAWLEGIGSGGARGVE